MAIIDPPYFIGYDGGEGWDDAWASEEEYLGWCMSWTRELHRVLKNGAMFMVWGTLKTDAFLRYRLRVSSEIPTFVTQNEIVWSYNWGGRSTKNFARKHEYVWCFSKGETFMFNADDVRVERRQKTNIRTGEPFTRGTVPTCVWEKNNHTMSREHVSWHPTQKPIALLERAIKAYTDPGATVLDCFHGSGSTWIACTRTGRRYMGCDSNETYVVRSFERHRTLCDDDAVKRRSVR